MYHVIPSFYCNHDLLAEYFQLNILLWFFLGTLEIQRLCNSFKVKLSVNHVIQFRKDGFVIIFHNNVSYLWGDLVDYSLTP